MPDIAIGVLKPKGMDEEDDGDAEELSSAVVDFAKALGIDESKVDVKAATAALGDFCTLHGYSKSEEDA
jgi:hypothetical protein